MCVWMVATAVKGEEGSALYPVVYPTRAEALDAFLADYGQATVHYNVLAIEIEDGAGGFFETPGYVEYLAEGNDPTGTLRERMGGLSYGGSSGVRGGFRSEGVSGVGRGYRRERGEG